MVVRPGTDGGPCLMVVRLSVLMVVRPGTDGGLGISIGVGGCFFKRLHLSKCINLFSCECASVQYVRSR